ncbi:ABC transporter permease [Mangrovicoccus algicola]|uniref:ABC transporter permease subunit n=1 Tax=Mangrovicoccus algicola TaxID=2771008 RepID=A0A8J7CJ22_9RHOB|nr:ABC transporter permease subunit [Mangrovicoccus algicola]MBE3637186.1 ABC transporter permease subunit [Mangrovicoccus algicola]
MDVPYFASLFRDLLSGLPLTLNLAFLALLGGFVLALLLNLARTTRTGTAIAGTYVFFFRGTPLLVQLFMIYFGIAQFEFIRSSFLWPLLREPYWCGLIALMLNDAAYTSEILRGGLRAVPRGTQEAARVSGMSSLQILRRVTLPIAVRQALPAYSNEIISMLKSTALVSMISLMDVTGIAREAVAETWRAVEIFLCAGLIYLVLSLIVTRATSRAERALSPWQFGARQ